jgi:hypothetical protein
MRTTNVICLAIQIAMVTYTTVVACRTGWAIDVACALIWLSSLGVGSYTVYRFNFLPWLHAKGWRMRWEKYTRE